MTDSPDQDDDSGSSGRHGGTSGGLSAAELIARMRADAAASPGGYRPSPRRRRSSEPDEDERASSHAASDNAVAPAAVEPISPAPPAAHVPPQAVPAAAPVPVPVVQPAPPTAPPVSAPLLQPPIPVAMPVAVPPAPAPAPATTPPTVAPPAAVPSAPPSAVPPTAAPAPPVTAPVAAPAQASPPAAPVAATAPAPAPAGTPASSTPLVTGSAFSPSSAQPPVSSAPLVEHGVPHGVDEPAPASKASRAGRDLPRATAVGAGLGSTVLLTLFLYRPSFAVLVTVAIVIGVFEMVKAIGTVEARAPIMPLVVGAVAMLGAAWFHGPDGLVGAFLLTVLGVAIWRLGDGAAGYLRDSASGAFIALYVPFLAGFAVMLAHAHDGAARVVLFVLAVVCSDTGGYAAGVLFGKHPMAPTVSPKKSWEGFAGSLVASSLVGALMMSQTFHEAWWKGVLFGMATAFTATLGDLGESMIKRDIGVKDMGHLLPGHGGIMDRLDSLLPCAAMAYLLLGVFAPV